MSPKRVHRHAFNEPRHAHELTFGCYQGFEFLSKERTCEWLADAIRVACAELEFALWAYVFMPNHLHLIVHPKQPEYDISTFLRQVKLPVSRKALAFLRSEAQGWLARLKSPRGDRTEYHFWQSGGGFDRNITEPGTLEKMINYIHLNPVRKGLVTRAVDWKWSSAAWMQQGAPNSLPIDRIPPEWTIGMSTK